MTAHPWDAIVRQIEEESDPEKIAELGNELNDAMIAEQRKKVKQRPGILVPITSSDQPLAR